MMRNSMNLFVLSGQGYVAGLDMTTQPAKVNITFFPDFLGSEDGDARPDQVSLECTVLPPLAEVLCRFDRRRPIAKGVTVRFKAAYRYFATAHSGQHREDPRSLVILKGELVQIRQWRQDSTALQWIRS